MFLSNLVFFPDIGVRVWEILQLLASSPNVEHAAHDFKQNVLWFLEL
jgi:hypothetical protein